MKLYNFHEQRIPHFGFRLKLALKGTTSDQKMAKRIYATFELGQKGRRNRKLVQSLRSYYPAISEFLLIRRVNTIYHEIPQKRLWHLSVYMIFKYNEAKLE